VSTALALSLIVFSILSVSKSRGNSPRTLSWLTMNALVLNDALPGQVGPVSSSDVDAGVHLLRFSLQP